MLIAEIGLNHLGNKFLAKDYIDKLIDTYVEGITFQVREPEYYNTNPHLKLSNNDYIELINFIKKGNKKVGIAIADINSIDFFENLEVDFYKVIRNDITNNKLIERLVSTNKKIIVSTGTCSETIIQNFIKKFKSNNIVLNHTQLSYDIKDCNLSAINTLKSKFNINVSYGSHCDNHNVLYMALCYQPVDILFYVKRNSSFKYPDNKHAILLSDVDIISRNLKNLNMAIGTGNKKQMKIKIK
tara:strand:+ start:2685 stop:3410 length:726 start_codon:yes stop_codon:yes gene_type:complete